MIAKTVFENLLSERELACQKNSAFEILDFSWGWTPIFVTYKKKIDAYLNHGTNDNNLHDYKPTSLFDFVVFHGISILVGYLMSNPLYIYIYIRTHTWFIIE